VAILQGDELELAALQGKPFTFQDAASGPTCARKAHNPQVRSSLAAAGLETSARTTYYYARHHALD